MKNFLFVVSIFVCVFCSQSSAEDNYQSWVVDPRYSLFPTVPIVAPNSDNEACRFDSQLFLEELRNKTLWATQMWDSSAKDPVGVLSGAVFHYGNFDECLKISAPFKVRYCLGHFYANISLKYYNFRNLNDASPSSNVWNKLANSRINPSKVPRDLLGWGLCVPSSCKASDLETTINSHLESFREDFYNETAFRIHIDEDFCTRKEEHIEFSLAEIAFWVVLFSLILLVATSTTTDLFQKKYKTQKSKVYKLWMLFSIKQNYPRLLPIEERKESFLDVFHGIKFVSILFIIYGHRVGIFLSLSALNYDDVEDYLLEKHKMFFVHTDLVVDTFFFISGLLACYVLMEILSKRFVNPLYSVAVRLFRIAPMYFFVLWYQATAAFRLGSGPLWNPLAKNETQYCVDHWWTNVLFISNYIKTDEMCLPHTWFLPCEIHFFAMTTILVPIIIKYTKLGRIILGVITLGFSMVPAVIIYVNKSKPLILFYYDFISQPRRNYVFNLLYIKSHNRAAVYLIGMTVGLFLHHKKDCKKKISMKLTLCGVLGWFAFLFAPMAYGSLYYNVHKSYNVVEAAVFGSLRRISWAIGFAIFIVTHRFGKIPIVDFFFSTKLAIFLSRLTYGMYLVHFTFVTADILKNRTPTSFSIHDVVIAGIGDIVKSAFVTVVLSFILEIPLKRVFREFVFARKIKEFEQPPPVQNVFTVRL